MLKWLLHLTLAASIITGAAEAAYYGYGNSPIRVLTFADQRPAIAASSATVTDPSTVVWGCDLLVKWQNPVASAGISNVEYSDTAQNGSGVKIQNFQTDASFDAATTLIGVTFDGTIDRITTNHVAVTGSYFDYTNGQTVILRVRTAAFTGGDDRKPVWSQQYTTSWLIDAIATGESAGSAAFSMLNPPGSGGTVYRAETSAGDAVSQSVWSTIVLQYDPTPNIVRGFKDHDDNGVLTTFNFTTVDGVLSYTFNRAKFGIGIGAPSSATLDPDTTNWEPGLLMSGDMGALGVWRRVLDLDDLHKIVSWWKDQNPR